MFKFYSKNQNNFFLVVDYAIKSLFLKEFLFNKLTGFLLTPIKIVPARDYSSSNDLINYCWNIQYSYWFQIHCSLYFLLKSRTIVTVWY